MDLMELATAERRELLDLLRTLEPQEWHTPSLCAGWTVRDVVAHAISYENLSPPRLAALFVRGRFGFDRVNALAMAPLSGLDGDALVGLLAQRLRPHGLTTGLGGGIALADAVIHTQDLRRPLDRPRQIPPERLRATLRLALRAPTLGARRLVRELRLEATDLDWGHGTGALVRGPAESLLMAVAGRSVALAELDGPGLPVLRSRCG